MKTMNELTIEKNSILNYLTDKVDGLGYEERTIHQATKDLFIKSDLMNLLRSKSNISSFKSITKEFFKNNEDDFYEDFKQSLKDKLNSKKCLNVSFLLNEEFLFKGKYFTLFNKKNLLSPNNCSFNDNTFSVIAEYTHKLIDMDNNYIKSCEFRPDFIFFINGIYFSYQELKFLTNGQNAKDQGREQIIDKYYNSYEIYESHLKIFEDKYFLNNNLTKEVKNTKRIAYKKDFLRIFTSPIHISSFDTHELYIIRNFNDMEQRFKRIKLENRKYEKNNFFNKSKEDFKKEPSNNWKEMIYNLLSKDMFEREILYYNMVEKEQKLVTKKYGKKELKNKAEIGHLISPRPKQKYGVDKTIKLVEEILDNEENTEYWINKTKNKIKELPKEIQKEILEKHTKFKNNKYIDSILLAYAAGFGKTNIIGWLSLLLKDIVVKEEDKKKYAYDTIFLITDRIELKEQINQKMKQMNVEKGLVVEVKKSSDFKDVMKKNTKIVIINIQKFTNIKKLFNEKEAIDLQNKRSVFIIDEIHRSNSGSQHEDMMSLFSQLFNNTNNQKKNLLIGLTATPSEETLLRFGEYTGCDGQGNIVYKPHDSYSMKESIDDGFTLPFHNNMTPIAISMEAYEKNKTQGAIDKEKYIESKSEIYENEERCDFISKTIVKQLFNNVYRKIFVGTGGKYQGKAMLACYSIQTALLHHKYIKQHIEDICNEIINNPSSSKNDIDLYTYYKKTGVYIVYSNSDNKSLPKANSLNNGDNEKTVINNFKNNRNGIMIVVDKLQTGFDEKKIHTLFLNTEKTGISLIQLLSRANRTLKGKNECHIIDFSHNNVNTDKNLPEAWSHFGGEIYSNTDIKSPAQQLEEDYKTLTQEKLYFKPLMKNYISYIKNPNIVENSNKILDLEKKVCSILKNNEEYSKELKNSIFSYFHNLQLLDNIIVIDKKYKNDDFKLFYQKLLNLFNNCKNGFAGSIIDIGYIFEEGGNIIDIVIPTTNEGQNEGTDKGTDSQSNLIDLFNDKETLKKVKIESFEEWLKLLIDFIFTTSFKEERFDLISKIKDNESNEKLLGVLVKLINKAKRKPELKKKIPIDFFNLLKENGLQDLLEIIKEEIGKNK